MSYIPPKFTDKDGRVYYGDIAWEKMWEKFLEFGRTTIPERPFANLPIKITDNHYPPSEGYRELLKKKEREILKNAIPDLSDAMLEAVLRRVYNMGDEKIKSLTWRQIFDFCKDYVKSQHNGSELTETGLSNKQDSGGKAGDTKPDLGKLKPTERITSMIMAKSSKENWEAIKNEYDISKNDFGKKINFVSDPFKRQVVFRDVEHAFVLTSQGFSKPAIILAGGVIEELLRLYLNHKNIKVTSGRFADYIKTCEDKKLLKPGVLRLTDSVRDFRNLVHLENEKAKRHTISKATAKGAVSSIFTIANDFQ